MDNSYVDETKLKELIDKRIELEDKIYILENEMEDVTIERDDLRKECDVKDRAVANLQRKVS